MSAATPGQAPPVTDVHALAMRVQEAWDSAFSRPSDTALDYRMARLAVETVHAAREPQPAPGHMMVMRGTIALREAEIELLNRKLAEEIRIHRELLEAVLRHADNEADRDYPTPEDRAQAYVELLEERNIELYSLIAQPEEPQPAAAPAAGEADRETPGGAA